MNNAQLFEAYAADFELTYSDNDWSRLLPYFTEEASYDSGDGSEVARGRAAILSKLEGAVNALDRKMGGRDLQIHSVQSSGDTVTAAWTIRLSIKDTPTLEVSGREVARFSGDAISEMTSMIDAASLEAFGAWMQTYGSSLAD